MQTWSIAYTADKHKSKKQWLSGTMNYNKTTKIAHFYTEDGGQLDQLKQCSEERVAVDAELELRRYLVEIGQLIGEEESVDDLFARLNEELGIEAGNGRSNCGGSAVIKPVSVGKPSTKLPPSKVPTKLDESDMKTCINCDILFTRDKHKKSKIWNDGILKFFPSRNLGEFWDDAGTLLHKKVMSAIKAGELFETSNLIIEVVGEILENTSKTETKQVEGFVNTRLKQQTISKPIPKPSMTASSAGSSDRRKFNLIFTADKHKKNTKKWIDGRVEWSPATGNAVFFNEDGECFYKRILPAGQIEIDSEFESGQYLFQIGEETTNEKPKEEKVVVASPVKRVMAPPAKKPKVVNQSIKATKTVPMTGRSDSELLSLLLSSKKENIE